MQRAQAAWLPCGRRLHLHHGPIDMILGIDGTGRDAAFRRAARRFDTLLDELVAELPRLRAPHGPRPEGETARIMAKATAPFAPEFITLMAAVAGAGAETILRAICAGPGIRRAYVNNGGDIAFHLAHGERFDAAIASAPSGLIRIHAADPVRGIATSGQGGRSHSLGIADSVTVLAHSAAQADAAATLIANAVDLPGHPAITRHPAREIAAESDLGERLVTTAIGPLTQAEIARALEAGRARAATFRRKGLIVAAHLTLQGTSITEGPLPQLQKEDLPHA
ncbi:MAG: UPF0280 family protein [Roseovarius sp.]